MAERVTDRRGATRVDSHIDAHITAEQGAVAAIVKNVSMSGLLLTTEHEVPEMTVVSMRIALPEPQAAEGDPGLSLDITGAVVRCQPCGNDEPQQYELAVFFTDLPKETRVALEEFIQHRIS